MYHRFVILSCLLCFFSQSYAIDWCSCNDDCLDTLLKCLLETFVVDDWTEQLNQRLECAKEAYCTPKPWDILDSKLKLINNFAKCMETIPGVQSFQARFNFQLEKVQQIEEYKCRRALVDGLPAELKVYWSILLQTPLDHNTQFQFW